jgi:hypothetical protein
VRPTHEENKTMTYAEYHAELIRRAEFWGRAAITAVAKGWEPDARICGQLAAHAAHAAMMIVEATERGYNR